MMTSDFQRRSRRTIPLFLACAAMIGTLTAAACSSQAGADAAAPGGGGRGGPAGRGGAPGGQAAVPVTVATATKKAVPLDMQVIGTVEAQTTVNVHAQITGALTEVRFREGDDVTQGQVLFTIDRRPLEAALAQAEATLARDVAQAANARVIAARQQELMQRGIAPREQVEQSRTSSAALDATVEADKAAIENARLQLQYATITAPISGRTGAMVAHAGSLVRANDQIPLVVINQVSPVSVSFGVPEGRLAELKRYIAQGRVIVTVQVPGGEGDDIGRINFIDNAVDRTTGMITVKASFDNRARRLWPGQFANVTVTLANVADAITVPTLAVQVGPQGQFVYVVKPDQTVEVRPVTVARTRGNESIIERGLAGDETVVTDGQLRLTPGSRISVKTEAPKATS